MRTQKRTDALYAPRFFRLAPALVLAIVAASSHAGSSTARDPHDTRISVTSVAGDVDVTMAGNAVTVAPDATVLLPARIVTGRDGNIGLTQAGTNIDIASDTDVEIPAEAVDGNLVARLVQHSGNVFYDVAPRDLGKLRVETPFLVAVIKGTQFNVAVDEDGTTISLFEGSLEIRTPDDSEVIELNAGEIAIRSLIDDSIRIVGMNDERAAAPRGPEPAAADAAPAAAQGEPAPVAAEVAAETAAPRESDPADRARRANDALVAVDRSKKDADVVTTGIDIVADALSLESGPASVALERRNDHARDRGHGRDSDLRAVEVDLAVDVGSADVSLEVDVDTGGAALETLPDVGDAALDLGGELDLVVDTKVDGVLDPSLDTGSTIDPSLDLGVDVSLDVAAPDLGLDLGTVDVDLSDVTEPTPVPAPRLDLVGLP